MNQHFTPYQLSGIAKLLTYKNSLTPEVDDNRLPFKAALRKLPGAFKIRQAQSFIDIFCEHLLADTDYYTLQQNAIHYNSVQQDIEKMTLDSVLKTITFIIWTDKSVEGYFYAKMHDKTIFYLISRLEAVFMQMRL